MAHMLEFAGSDLDRIVKMTVVLADPGDYDEMKPLSDAQFEAKFGDCAGNAVRRLPNASIDAALGDRSAGNGGRRAGVMAPFAEHHGKDAVGACLDRPSPNGMLGDASGRIGRWRS